MQKNDLRKNTIRAMISSVSMNEHNGGAQNEFEMHKVFLKMIHERETSSAEFKALNRFELAEKEAEEAALIQKFDLELPVPSAVEIKEKVDNFLKELHADNPNMKLRTVFKYLTDEVAVSFGGLPSMVKRYVKPLYGVIFEGKSS